MKILDVIPDEKQDVARRLLTECNFMRSQLVSLRKDIKKNGSIELYENGRQKCTRIRPSADLYVKLAGKYSTYCRQLEALIDPSLGEIDELDVFLAEN